MKKIKFLVVIGMLLFATSVYAQNELTTTVENNNYLGIGQSKDVNHSQGEINSHLQPMSTPYVINPEYNGPVFKDHKIQNEILNFLLSEEGLRPFRIVKVTNGFSKNITETESKCLIPKPLKKCNRVFVFKSKEELKNYTYKTIGYIDAYSDGNDDETLMQCFNQAVLDTGRMGANAFLILKSDFMAGMKSSTVGIGSSGAGGFMHGGSDASVYGAAIGYASSTAKPKTNPYIHGVAIYIDSLSK